MSIQKCYNRNVGEFGDGYNRKRRMIMRQKCNYIDHEICVNIQKLDTLLELFKSKKQQIYHLSNITQLVNGQQSGSQNMIQVRRQRRLKFKYSIDREYEFEQNNKIKENNLLNDFNNQTKYDKQMINEQNENQEMLLQGFMMNDNFLTEMISQQNNKVLKTNENQIINYNNRHNNNSDNIKQQKSILIRHSQHKQNTNIYIINIQTRYNWILKYLNHSFNDTILKTISSNNQSIIEIIKFNPIHNHFQCKHIQSNYSTNNLTNITNLTNLTNLKNQNNLTNLKNQTNLINLKNQTNLINLKNLTNLINLKNLTNLINLKNLTNLTNQINKLEHKKVKFQDQIQQITKNNQYFNYKSNQFLNQNQFIQVQFPKHTHHTKIINSKQQQVVKLSLLDKNNSIRILIKSDNINNQQMQRIIIFQQLSIQNKLNQLNQLNQMNINEENQLNKQDEKYKIVWTKYDKQNFIQDIILQGGYNYLITNLCCSPSSQVNLIINPVDLNTIKINKTQYNPWKSYNILCSTFQQCNKVFMSQNVFDDKKPLQYLRANYLDYGLVLQIYQNIHSQKISYINQQDLYNRPFQDISLLFSQIYTEQQNTNIYQPDQLVIKFYQLTQKPARLYYPQKKIIIGNQISQQITIHSTFK